jgi:hypothetical protein
VSDLPKLCTVLERDSVEFTQPLSRRPGGAFRAWVRDRDGHALELAETAPAA